MLCGVLAEEFDDAQVGEQGAVLLVAGGSVGRDGGSRDRQPCCHGMDQIFHLGKGEPASYRLIHDAGRGLWIKRVVVDVQVDLVDLASQLLQHTDDVALWPALLPGDGMDGGVLQPVGLCWRGEAAHTSQHDQRF